MNKKEFIGHKNVLAARTFKEIHNYFPPRNKKKYSFHKAKTGGYKRKAFYHQEYIKFKK